MVFLFHTKLYAKKNSPIRNDNDSFFPTALQWYYQQFTLIFFKPPTAPGMPRWSPIQVVTRPDSA